MIYLFYYYCFQFFHALVLYYIFSIFKTKSSNLILILKMIYHYQKDHLPHFLTSLN